MNIYVHPEHQPRSKVQKDSRNAHFIYLTW